MSYSYMPLVEHKEACAGTVLYVYAGETEMCIYIYMRRDSE